MSTLTLLVPDMTCRHCVRKVTAALRDVAGVQLVQADLTTTSVVLRGDPTVADVLAALDLAGFPGTAMPAPGPNPDTSDGADTATDATSNTAAANSAGDAGAVPG
jgi:copper chaperone